MMRLFNFPSLPLAAAMMALATPTLAQDFCGGRSAGGTWIGGAAAASDITTTGVVNEQMALVLGGNEYVSLFNLSGPTDVRVEAQGRGAGDPQIDLIDAEGNIMLSDDDGGGNGAARAETSLEAGNYCLAVRSYDGSPMTSFVRVTRQEQEPLTAGLVAAPAPTAPSNDPVVATGSCDTARALFGSIETGGFEGSGSVNDGGFWQFSLETPTALTLRAANQDADPVMTLYDATDTVIAENDDYDGLDSQIDFDTPLDAGDYCIQITSVNDDSLPIDVSVVAFDPAAALRDQVNAGDVAPPLDGSFLITTLGTLDTRLRQDITSTPEAQWFSVEMPEAGLLLVESVAVNGEIDPWMVAYDDLGRKIGQNDDYGDGFDSLLAARVAAGTYIIGVKQLEDEGTGNLRMVLERYTAAR